MRGKITIGRLNAGTGDDRVRIVIRRDGEPPAKRMILGMSFEAFSRALMGEAEVVVDVEKDIG